MFYLKDIIEFGLVGYYKIHWKPGYSIAYNPDTLKYRVELTIGWRAIPLTGFWFNRKQPTANEYA